MNGIRNIFDDWWNPSSSVLGIINRVNYYDWYVDSVNGSDGYSGKTPSLAFATIGTLNANLAFSPSGQTVGLARGSWWREQLTLTSFPNTKLFAYGTGARPKLDCADIVANASFTLTGGQTYTYQVSVTPEWGGFGTEWLNAFENGAFLKRASSIANCEATSGSYFPSAAAGTITLYIHASDDSDVTANGKTYEFTKRYAGIYGQNVAGLQITGIETARNLGDSGSMVVGRSATITDCVCSYGGKHNIEYAGGSVLTSVTCSNAYHGTVPSGVMFILFEDDGAGANVSHVNCTAINAVYDNNISGFGGHVGSGKPDFGTVNWSGCTGTNLGYMFSNTSDMPTVNIADCTATGCLVGVSIDTAGGTYNITNFSNTTTLANSFPIAVNQTATVNIVGGTQTVNAPGSTNNGIITTGTTNSTVLISGVTFRLNNTTGNRRVVDSRSTGANITLTGNDYGGTATSIFVLYQTVAVPFTSDNNRFRSANLQNYINATSYANVAAYQAATGQDAHSTVG